MTSLRWLGHATVLLELGGARLLTDPLLGARLGHLSRRVPVPGELGRVDAVLVSHVHRDHLDMSSLAALAGTPAIVAPLGAGDLLRDRGFEHVIELEEGESTALRGVRVTATAAHHRARRGLLSPWVPSLGFVIEGACACISRATPTSTKRWRSWRRWTSRCCRCGAGGRGSGRGT